MPGGTSSSACVTKNLTVPPVRVDWTCGLELKGPFNCNSKRACGFAMVPNTVIFHSRAAVDPR